MSDDGRWGNAYPQVEIRWDDCTIGFVCVCGDEQQVDDQGDQPVICDCGRQYRMAVRFEMSAVDRAPESP